MPDRSGEIRGTVHRMPRIDSRRSGKVSLSARVKVPHMGWNQVHHENSHPIFQGVPEDSACYFVHSYYPRPRNPENAVAWTEYGVRFASALQRENLVALQFHPEKSAAPGLKMLENFIYRV